MAHEYDLTSTIGAYLDRHLVFPLLEFLSDRGIYDEQELLQGRIELLQHTNMVDFAVDDYKALHGTDEVPEEMIQKRQSVVTRLKELQANTDRITTAFDTEEFQAQAKNTRDGKQLFEYLRDHFKITREMLNELYTFAKFQYECGNYGGASEYLYFYRVLVPSDDKYIVGALWGKLASAILMQHWDQALEDLTQLREIIDSDTFSPALQQLQNRTWIIHWSLFVFFNHPKGMEQLIDLFLYSPLYLNAIQTTCPHILRYLTTAVITSKRRKDILKDLVKIIQQESYTYKDPITEFLECLLVNFDFDGAQQKLRECEKVLLNDFFLVACLDEFVENARSFIFQTFCRIHQCISIKMLSDKLNMTPEEAERWIVNLIQYEHRLDAKVDSKEGHVVMGTQAPSVHQQVIEKTKNLLYKTQELANKIEGRMSSHSQQYVEPFAMMWGTYDGLHGAHYL